MPGLVIDHTPKGLIDGSFLQDSTVRSDGFAWFPFMVLAALERRGVQRATLTAAMISVIAGYDGVRRLYPWDGGC